MLEISSFISIYTIFVVFIYLIFRIHVVIFHTQGDEDLVSEFVANEGLSCLLDVGQKCDQTCQQYVLKGEHHNK